MLDPQAAAQHPEAQFAALVDALATDPIRRESLLDLLREEHPVYRDRGAAAIVRMRGWVLLALARKGVTDRELPFVLEEFDVGTDAYLVAAAARALRSYAHPSEAFLPFVLRALSNIRDEPLSFESYGEYALSSATTAVSESLAVLAWLGPCAHAALPELAAMRGRLSKKLLSELDRTVAAIREGGSSGQDRPEACCLLPVSLGQTFWTPHQREDTQ